MQTTICVVMPCHNGAPWVRAALHSIAGQERPAEQVIVVDDCSTDASLEEIEGSGVELRLVQTRFGNAAAARNAGARASDADWIAFLDADNHWFPNHLQLLTEGLCRNPDAVAGYSWPGLQRPAERPGEPELRGTRLGPELRKYDRLHHDDFLVIRGLWRYGFPTTGMVVRRDRFQAIGGFNEQQRRRHDFDMFMRATLGHTWFACEVPTWWSRPPRPGDISSNKIECHRFALQAMQNHLRVYPTRLMEAVVEREARATISALLKGPLTTRDDALWDQCLEQVPVLRRMFYRLKYQYTNVAAAARP